MNKKHEMNAPLTVYGWSDLFKILSRNSDLVFQLNSNVDFYGKIGSGWRIVIGKQVYFHYNLDIAIDLAIKGIKRNEQWRICWRFNFNTINSVFQSEWGRDLAFIELSLSEVRLTAKEAWIESSLWGRLSQYDDDQDELEDSITEGEIELARIDLEAENIALQELIPDKKKRRFWSL